jgi:acetoin utilization deacetylase AcuC-like enzyme
MPRSPSARQRLPRRWGATELPEDRGEGPIRAVHDAGYIDFLKTAPARWAEAGRPGDVMGYIWPTVRKRALKLDRIDALAGQYSIDASTPLTADTWDASYRSVQCALAATHAVLGGERAAFALSRPPGHHAGADYLGGYCYLNHVAVAAQAARDAGGRASRDPRYRLSPRQRDAGYFLGARGRVLCVDPCRSGDRLSVLLGPCR